MKSVNNQPRTQRIYSSHDSLHGYLADFFQAHSLQFIFGAVHV